MYSEFSSAGYFAATSTTAISAAGRMRPEATNFTGGFEAGYNFQSGRWVYGLEADIGAMNHDETRRIQVVYPCCAPTAFFISQRVQTGWLTTVRPRLGYASGKALFFISGGLAVTDLKYKGLLTDTFNNAAESKEITPNKTGWLAGGGLEYKVSRRWSLKGEYYYSDFGQLNATSTNLTVSSPPVAVPANVFHHESDFQSHIVRFGLNWHF